MSDSPTHRQCNFCGAVVHKSADGDIVHGQPQCGRFLLFRAAANLELLLRTTTAKKSSSADVVRELAQVRAILDEGVRLLEIEVQDERAKGGN